GTRKDCCLGAEVVQCMLESIVAQDTVKCNLDKVNCCLFILIICIAFVEAASTAAADFCRAALAAVLCLCAYAFYMQLLIVREVLYRKKNNKKNEKRLATS
ncbi:unnamed protein product, partial [Ixodes hexagonus]